jgi:hypothetical protein
VGVQSSRTVPSGLRTTRVFAIVKASHARDSCRRCSRSRDFHNCRRRSVCGESPGIRQRCSRPMGDSGEPMGSRWRKDCGTHSGSDSDFGRTANLCLDTHYTDSAGSIRCSHRPFLLDEFDPLWPLQLC